MKTGNRIAAHAKRLTRDRSVLRFIREQGNLDFGQLALIAKRRGVFSSRSRLSDIAASLARSWRKRNYIESDGAASTLLCGARL